MSRRLRFVGVAAVAALALTACGFGGGQGGGGGGQAAGSTQISLLVPSYADGTKGRWEKIISDFQAANPDVQVALEVQSWDNINDVVRTKVQANQAPDMLNIDAYSGFAQDDLLYPATEIASPETIADLQPSFVQNATLNGTQQAMPLIASTRTLFYNKDLFAQAGIAAPPKTWDELLAAAKKIQALGLPDTYGYGMPLGSEEAQAETSIWTFGAGGSWGDRRQADHRHPAEPRGPAGMRQLIDDQGHPAGPGRDRPHPADQRVHPGQDRHDRGPAADRRPDQREEPGPEVRHRADPDQGRHAGHAGGRRLPVGLQQQRGQGRRRSRSSSTSSTRRTSTSAWSRPRASCRPPSPEPRRRRPSRS